MPVCSRCGIGYIDAEGHVCEGRRFRQPVNSATAFLRRLQLAAVPSAVLAVVGTIEIVIEQSSADGFLVHVAGAAFLISVWLQFFTVPYVTWLWAWRRPVNLRGAIKRNALILTSVVLIGCVVYIAIIARGISR
jgi:hypothetical protein